MPGVEQSLDTTGKHALMGWQHDGTNKYVYAVRGLGSSRDRERWGESLSQ